MIAGHPQGRGRRLLRRPHTRRVERRRGARAAPGNRRTHVGQAVLPLQRRALARRRPGRSAAARVTQAGPQPRVVAPQQLRRHLDAGPVGVPLVRRMGPRLPLHPDRPRRPGVRQGPAAADAARVVHAPQRTDPCVRVELQRRQPARPRRGCPARVPDRRLDGLRVPGQASSTSCCSTSRGGSTARTPRATTSSRAASSGWTTSGRSTGRRCCPSPPSLEQSDGTAWMAMYALNLLEMALLLAEHDRAYEDSATKFFEHFAYIAERCRQGALGRRGRLLLRRAVFRRRHARCPCACARWSACSRCPRRLTLGQRTLGALPDFAGHLRWFLANKPEYRGVVGSTHVRDGGEGRLLSVVDGERLTRVLSRMLDEDEFLSPYGLRAISRGSSRRPVHRSTWAGSRTRSTTSQASPPRTSSGATRTGAARCGSP